MADNALILIVEDDLRVQNFIRTILTANRYDVLTAGNGMSAYEAITSECPDVIILDLGLPDMDGMAIINMVRQWSQVPIIVVSARVHERDKVLALDAGANDYITKPFGPSELLARIRVALRTADRSAQYGNKAQTGRLAIRDMLVDYDNRCVHIRGEDARLTQSEYAIVALFSAHVGKVLTYDFIIRNLWGSQKQGDIKNLRVHMANLRRKIELSPAEPEYFLTETGVGYRLTDDSSPIYK